MKGKGSFFYPSVECGPISNQKAKKILKFKPSKIDEAIKKTVDFFKNAEMYTTESKKAMKKVNKAILIK